MRRRIDKLAPGVFMAIALAVIGWYSMHKPSILIVHSYAPDYAWVRDVDIGLNRVLDARWRYQVRWYYMDTKRHPSEAYKRSAGAAARQVIEATRPNVLIAIDDDAQQFVARHFVNDARLRIVFAGVNRQARDYGYESAANVTGILERIPLAALREALQSAASADLTWPARHGVRLAVLGDRSATTDGDLDQIRRFDWRPLQLGAVRQVATWAQWQTAVLAAPLEHDVLLLTGYRGLARSATDPALVPPAEVVAWTESHSPLPVLAVNAFYVEDGGMLALGASPWEQGEVAGARALELIFRQPELAGLPITQSQQFVVSMSGARMRARGFTLPRVYEAAARSGNLYLP